MSFKTDPRVWTRARIIYESEVPSGVAWGDVTPNGRTALSMQEHEGPVAPRNAILGEEGREPYLKRAADQLRAEGIDIPEN